MNNEIMKKKITILFYLFIFLPPFFSSSSEQKIVDCIAATVDREIITLVDIKIYREFILLAGKKTIDPEEFLGKIVEIRLVAREAKKELSLNQEEILQALDDLFRLMGEEKVRERMRAYGLSLSDLEIYLREKLLYDKMLAHRASQQVSVTLKEIENYYLEKYIADSKTKKEEVRPLVEVISEIENRIRQDKIREQMNIWIKGLKDRALIKINQSCLKMLEEEEEWRE